ncbi:MAG: DUF2249 domain-containing protein [Armatimonadetes bacterium]|nr:DUF2249 domain-containing protein [Armatimonadota bacterium]
MSVKDTDLLDVRNIVPRDRHPLIFKTFDSLQQGESLVLMNDHDPRPLLYQFQMERPGRFEWSPLEQGPEIWRIEIAKRAEAQNDKRTIADYLEWDHDRLDGIFAAFLNLVRSSETRASAEAFHPFRLGLLRHIRMEEELLFPTFEEKTGMGDGGPTYVMRLEHDQIKGTLAAITGLLDGETQADPVLRQAEQLTSVLTDHNNKEEQILYPWTDQALGETSRDELVRKMQAI